MAHDHLTFWQMGHHRSIDTPSPGMYFSWTEVPSHGPQRSKVWLRYLQLNPSTWQLFMPPRKHSGYVISEVFQPLECPITLYLDSQSAIALTKDSSYHARTKHIDIRYHFICFEVQKGFINLIYCPTEEMTADVLTKALPNAKAKHFAKMLGLRPTWGGV